MHPNVVDLFCGCGGFSLGAHAAGIKPRIALDADATLTSSFGWNFPHTQLVLADLARVSGRDLVRYTGGQIDGIFGGPPCQAFSEIGQRKADDPRRSLLGHFFRLVAEAKPAFFVMENVRGLSYPNARGTLENALNLLPGFYNVLGPIILNAADFGAATKRSRLFVLGYDPARFEALTIQSFDALKRPPATVRNAIADLTSATFLRDLDGFDIWKINQRGRPSRYAAALRSTNGLFTGHRRTVHAPGVVRRLDRVAPGGSDIVGRYPRLNWEGQCPTLRAGTGVDRGSFQAVRPIHPDEPRVITVREAARLQGFPDRFYFHSTIWQSFRMIGNSVSPLMSAAIFSVIVKHLGTEATMSIAAE